MTRTQSFIPFGVASSLSLATLLAASPASAGGFAVARFGGERGHAATDHVSAIYFNPAGLALGEGVRVHVEGTLAYRAVDYVRDPAAIDNVGAGTPDDAVAANSGKAELRNFVASPFAGAAVEIFDGFSMGLGFYVPFGGQAKWDQNDAWAGNQQYPGAVDGSQRWASIEGSQRAVYYTLAAAWRTKDRRFAIGGGFNVVQNNLDLIRARNLDSSDDLIFPSNGAVAEGRSLLLVDGVNFSASLGAMAHITDCFRVGVSYQSQPDFGPMVLDGTLTNKFGSDAEGTTKVELHQELPDVYRIAAEWNAFRRGSLRFGVDYTRWSAFDNQCLIDKTLPNGKCKIRQDGSLDTDAGGANVLVNIPRQWDDNFSVHVGGSYYPTDAIELNAGVTYDTSAIPDETLETALIDSDKAIGTLGGVFDFGRFSLESTLGGVFYAERDTDPRSTELVRPGKNPDMAGNYKQFVTYLIVGLGVEI